jgi:hypothetical protein
MAVNVSCPQCHESFPISAELLGKKMRCRSCKAVFIGQAAPVKVGASGSENKSAIAGGSNGVHAEPRRAASPPTKPADKSATFAFIGIGTAVALMTAITVWAVFLRESKEPDTQQFAGNGNVSKINIADSPKIDSTTKPEADKSKEQAKAEKPAERPKITVAKFDDTPKNYPYRIDPATEERAKKSATWVKVGNKDGGGGTGTGWMVEPGIMITNSHVVEMKDPSAAPPAFVRVVFDSGLKSERILDGKILGLDRENDLAVVRIEGDNLPDPMPIVRSSLLNEGQHLWVVGFPYGNLIAKVFASDKHTLETRVSVRQTTVNGRMRRITGSVKYIQIEGGASPGNSGSMIVDSLGNVRSILVAGLHPGLVFSIPCEYVVYLLQGRMLSLVPSQPIESEGVVRQHLTSAISDPMKRIKSVALELWVGEPGRRIRPSSETQPSSLPGDGARQTVEMTYNPDAEVPIGASREAKGEWSMPEIGSGQVFWVQPRYTGTDGKMRWDEAVVLETPSLAVQRKPATLTIHHKAGDAHKVHMESHIGISAAPEGGELRLKDNGVILDLTEKTISVQPDGGAKMQFTYNDLRPSDEDEDYQLRNMIRGLLDAAKGMVTEMQVSKRGLIRSPKADLKKIPVAIRPILEPFNIQTVQSLEALSLALPDRELKPGETWQHDQNYTVSFGRRLTENALFKMTYRYVGTRIRNDREEAVVEFDGTIVRGEGSESPVSQPDGDKGGADKNAKLRIRGMHGAVRGSALVDLATGLTSIARTTGNLEFEVPYVLQMLKFAAELRIDLQREVVPGLITKDPQKLLPNQEITLNPFVGSPEHKLTLTPTPADDRTVTTNK